MPAAGGAVVFVCVRVFSVLVWWNVLFGGLVQECGVLCVNIRSESYCRIR